MSLARLGEARWVFEDIPGEKIKDLAKQLGLPYLLVVVLWKRGLRDEISIKRFLNPSEEILHDPFLLPDMESAVTRLLAARDRNEKILVHGDYDTDGISGTALLIRGLARLGFNAGFYLPHRIRDGYGLSIKSIEEAKRINASLILTVDCGVTAIEESRILKEEGFELVITDHHVPLESLPEAAAVVDPKRKDSRYPFQELSGVGVAYKLLAALSSQVKNCDYDVNDDLDLVALGTIADVVPLKEENRFFAKFGLERLSESDKPGVSSLLEIAKMKGKAATSSNVAFGIAPRLNASGRMADGLMALRLLLTDEETEAKKLVTELDKHNNLRKQTEDAMLEDARVLTESIMAEPSTKVIICKSPEWHEGILGIVAARLVDEFYRPVILFTEKDGVLKGSARSIPGFHIFEALYSARDTISNFGGHEAAAGLVLQQTRFKAFNESINAYASSIPEEVFIQKLNLDAEIELSDIDDEIRNGINKLSPFGIGNPEPCFMTRGLEIVGNPRVFGKNHLAFTVRKSGATFPVMAFRKADLILTLEPGKKGALDIAYEIAEDNYWGKNTVKLIAKDIHLNIHSEE